MSFIEGKCPACAKVIEIPSEEEKFYCPYCGSQFLRNAAVAFMQSPSSVDSESDFSDFDIIGGTLVNYTGTASAIIIPSSVSCIAESAFSGRKTLQNIVIPESVTTIADYAFKDCTSLRTVEFSKSLITVGEKAFNGCSSLKEARFSPSIRIIGDEAFRNCPSLTQAYLPSSCKYVWLHKGIFSSDDKKVSAFDSHTKIVTI